MVIYLIALGFMLMRFSRKFELSENYKILPFKGIYWKLNSNIKFNFKTNIYPVPDLNLPFLGVHITPNTKGEVFLGPTAIPAFGKENYNGFEGFEPIATTKFLGNLAFQWLINSMVLDVMQINKLARV